MDFIYRVMDYYVAPDHADNELKSGDRGAHLAPKADFSLRKRERSLYTFSLGDPRRLEQFLLISGRRALPDRKLTGGGPPTPSQKKAVQADDRAPRKLG